MSLSRNPDEAATLRVRFDFCCSFKALLPKPKIQRAAKASELHQSAGSGAPVKPLSLHRRLVLITLGKDLRSVHHHRAS